MRIHATSIRHAMAVAATCAFFAVTAFYAAEARYADVVLSEEKDGPPKQTFGPALSINDKVVQKVPFKVSQ